MLWISQSSAASSGNTNLLETYHVKRTRSEHCSIHDEYLARNARDASDHQVKNTLPSEDNARGGTTNKLMFELFLKLL